jgi:5'-nucleotidase
MPTSAIETAWITTFSGNKFHILDPRPEEVLIEDIAHALSLLTRFTGHVRRFYSVAQHSVIVSGTCLREDALAGLLHDASEAYLADLNSPLKHSPEMARYRTAEKRLQTVIYERFGLPPKEPASVKFADRRMVVTEARDLLPGGGKDWVGFEDVTPLFTHIVPWNPELAEAAFLQRFNELYKGDSR